MALGLIKDLLKVRVHSSCQRQSLQHCRRRV
jgi:hypothetical protein